MQSTVHPILPIQAAQPIRVDTLKRPSFVPRSLVGRRTRSGPLRVALVEPRYQPSYYGMDYLLPLLPGQPKAAQSGGALPLLAAFVKPPHEVALFNENTGDVDLAALTDYDIIGLTGMIVQRQRMREILESLKDFPGIVIVGGPYASVDEQFFSGLCDVIFVGEADTSWPRFLETVASGEPWGSRHEQVERTDMTALPLPRYDLLDPRKVLVANVQFSRGCPFLCEFCDIITIFGRVPRAKRPEQVIAELEMLRRQGFRVVFLVDDNFIGNRKLAREMLHALVAWQEANDYPLVLTTEASINLADDPELLSLMEKANFRMVFIGIETPNLESLGETRKVQNVRGDGLLEKVARVRDAGLLIEGGFMVGFDNDGPDIFERQYQFIQASGIARAAVSILSAIPSTPLFDRLRAEGRLRLDDPACNFVPARMTAAELRQGYLDLTRRIYDAPAYFERVFGSFASSPKFRERWHTRTARERKGWRTRLLAWAGAALTGARLLRVLARDGELRLLRDYARIWADYRRHGPPGISLPQFVSYAALHWHAYRHYREGRDGGHKNISIYSYTADTEHAPHA